MKKRAADYPWGDPQEPEITEEDKERAKEWVTQTPEKAKQEGFYEQEQKAASKMFFQAWTTARGKGRSANIMYDEPLKITVWRSRSVDHTAFISQIMENMLPYYVAALRAVYPELQQQALGNSKSARDLKQRLTLVDRLIGEGSYEHESLQIGVEKAWEEKERILQEKKDQGGSTKRLNSERDAIEAFYSGISSFPGLQQNFLEHIVEQAYTDFSKAHTGTTGRYPNALLTFYMMDNPYPYLVSSPAECKTQAELEEKYPDGTTEENPAPGVALADKRPTFEAFRNLADKWFVQNVPNPDYKPIQYGTSQFPIGPKGEESLKNDVADRVSDLMEKAMFTPNFYIAKQVTSADFGDQPGIRLQDLGKEKKGIVIPGSALKPSESTWIPNVEERDITSSPSGGLFTGEPPERKEKIVEEVKKKPSGKFTLPKGYPKISSKESLIKTPKQQIRPSADIFSRALIETFAQTAGGDLWIDDGGKIYDSMEQLLQQDQSGEEMDEVAFRAAIKEAVVQDLGSGLAAPQPEAPEVQPTFDIVEEEDFEEENVIQLPQEQEDEVLAPAASKIKRLVALAEQLDKQGLTKQADRVDQQIQNLLDKMSK